MSLHRFESDLCCDQTRCIPSLGWYSCLVETTNALTYDSESIVEATDHYRYAPH
jgi:hypothetical protein